MARKKRGVIDPGHGGWDRWNVGPNGYVEADGVLKISKYMKKFLEDTGKFEIKLTRDDDTNVVSYAERDNSLYQRSVIARDFEADFIFSQHTNAASNSSAGGVVNFYSVKQPQAKELALSISRAISEELGISNRGAKTRPNKYGNDYYGMLRFPVRMKIPLAILTESMFHSNPEEEAMLKKDSVLKRIAEINAEEICGFYGIPFVKEEEETRTLYRVQTGAFKLAENAEKLEDELNDKGYHTYHILSGGYNKIQVGAYSKKENAEAQAKKLKKDGFETYITTKGGDPYVGKKKEEPKRDPKVGDMVLVKKGACSYEGACKLSNDFYTIPLRVDQLRGDRAVLDIHKRITAFHVDDLIIQ